MERKRERERGRQVGERLKAIERDKQTKRKEQRSIMTDRRIHRNKDR
jgi:hypothetical protein